MKAKIKAVGKQVKQADEKVRRRVEELRQMAQELRTEAMLLEVAATAEENRVAKLARLHRTVRKHGLAAGPLNLGVRSGPVLGAAG